MKERIITMAVGLLALSLVGYGAYMAWRPLGFLVPGLLLWMDVSHVSLGGGEKNVTNRTDSG